MSRISKLASPRKGGDDCGDVRDVGTDFVEDVIKSGDTIRITEELRKLDKKSARQREHNAQLLSKILNLQGNIQVCCRVRPLRMSELQQGNKSVVEAFSESEIGCFDARSNKWKSFGFDRVWGPDQSQQDVFQDVEPLALSVVDGYNACIFAYGQT
jgi:kinesin family protein C2/C3